MLQGHMKMEFFKPVGVVPHWVMKDERLTLEAKAIFAYLVSKTSAAGEYPVEESEILRDLGISQIVLDVHKKILIDNGFVSEL